jgi:hypothetical protein
MEKFMAAAEVINQAYNVESTFDETKHYDYMVVYDDDITAILKSIGAYKKVKANNPAAKLVVVGGEGLLATAFAVMRFSLKVRGKKSYDLKKESEAGRLKRVAMSLGVPEDEIIVLDKGRNTTENLQAISELCQNKMALVVSTQILAMVFRQSADFQCNEEPYKHGCFHLDYDMFVIKETVAETLHWYNFQAAGNGRVALHLYASLVRRFDVYDGKFLRKPFEADEATKKADAILRNRFLIKQRVTGFKKIRAMLQYLPIVWDIFWHAEDYLNDEFCAILDAEHV